MTKKKQHRNEEAKSIIAEPIKSACIASSNELRTEMMEGLDKWREVCKQIETLPNSNIITGGKNGEGD